MTLQCPGVGGRGRSPLISSSSLLVIVCERLHLDLLEEPLENIKNI